MSIAAGDIVSHDKYDDDDRFLVQSVEDGVATAVALDPSTGDVGSHSILLAECRLTRHSSGA